MVEARRRSTTLRARSKVWIERDGQVVMSEYRARLLEAIRREGSVAAAADALGLPNRTAWKKLREVEEAAGTALLSRLTPAGEEILLAFRRIADPVDEDVQERFIEEREHFRR